MLFFIITMVFNHVYRVNYNRKNIVFILGNMYLRYFF